MQKFRMKKYISLFVTLVLLVTLMQAISVVFPKLDLNTANAAVVNGSGANDSSLRIQFKATFASGTYPTLAVYLSGNTNLTAEWLNVTNPTSYTTYAIPDTASNSGGYTTWTCSSLCPASGDIIEVKISRSSASGDLVGLGTSSTATFSSSFSSNVYDVVSFGNFPSFQLLQYAFKSTSPQFRITAQLPTTVTSLKGAFSGSFANPDLSGWNTSSITDMSNMFETAQYFNQNIGNWNTSAVTNMSTMFMYANIFNQNIGNWNTIAVTNMSRMFQSATAFNQNIGNWNTGAVTDLSNMFNAAGSFNQNIGSWNTSAVTTMASMFSGAGSFNQKIGSWNTSAVTTMASMFNSATSFNNGQSSGVSGGADLTFATANVTNFSSMFYSAVVFNQKVSSFDTSKATTLASMFNRARAFNNGQAPGGAGSNPIQWNTSNVTTINSMFLNSQASVFNQNLSGWDLSKCTDFSGAFIYSAAFNNGSADGQSSTLIWTLNTAPTASVNFYQLFQNASKFNADISGWNTSRVTRMDNLFFNAAAFNQPLQNWNTSQVSTFSNMFNGATSFNQNIGSWNTGAVTTTTFMFNGATSFNQNIGSWNTRSLLNISSMFQGASVFNQDISGWNTSSVSNMSNTFNSATAFNQDLSSFQLSSLDGSPLIGVFGSSGSSGMSSDNLERTTTSWSHQSARTVFPTAGTYDAIGKPRWVNCVGYFAYLRMNAKIPMTTWGTLGATPSGCTTATIAWYGAATTQTVTNSLTSFTPESASSTSGVSPRYVVINRGTTLCRVNNSTGQITYTTAGTCTVRAYDVAAATNGDATTFKDVAFTLPTPTTPTQLSTPSAPTTSATSGSTTSINVSYTTVSNASSYTARVYLASDGTTLVGSAITSFSSGSAITGLSANTAYKATITAIGNGTTYLDSAASSLSSSVTTNPAAVTPTISGHPQSNTKNAGQSITFSVTATSSDSGNLTYQWKKGGTAISGATSSSFQITSIVSGDAGEYTVTVTNTKNGSAASTDSTAATLTVAITTPQPVVPTLTKFDVQVKSGNSTLVPDKTLTSLLSANYSPTYSRYQDVAFTVNATTTDAGVLTWQIKEGTNCSSTATVISGSTGLTINTTRTISTWNTSTCYIVEVINTLNGVTSSVLSSYQFLPQFTTTPLTVNATTAANNLSGVVGASFSNATPFSVSGGGGSWQYYLTSAPAGLSINVSTGAITGTFTTVSTGSGAYIKAVDANGGTAYALVGPITWSVTAGAALTPTFGTPTSTADGFTVSITNYDAAFTWATPTVGSGLVSVTSTSGTNRVLTVTGLSPGASATITQGTSRTGYTSGSATVSGTSISIPAPAISSFASSNANTPSSAVFGSTVTTTGTNFSNATAVKLGTTAVSSFTVVNSTTITFTVNAASGSTYAISVTTAGGTATSSTNLTVTPEVPIISTQPSSATRSVGSSVTFTVVIGSVSETGTVLSYQWKKGSNNISGATSSSYTISSPTVADAGDYSVTISNTSANTTAVAFLASNAATLTMNTANTNTSFTASSTTPTFGTAVTLTATVTTGATGTVAFKDSSNNTLCTSGNLSSGSANCSWTPSSAGDFVVRAIYEGDVNYSTSTSSTTTVSVSKANQTTLTISSLGSSSKSYPYSQALNATTSGGSGSGDVTYAIESGGTATSCTLSSNLATATLTATTAGTCLIKATKAGGTNYNDVTSATATFTFSDVAPGAPTISAITAGFGSLSIAFTAGTNNGTALTNYAYSTDGGATFKNLVTPGTTSPIVITTVSGSSSSLVAGTTYSVKIRAINTMNGADSAAVSGTPRAPTVPGKATGVISVSTATSLNVTIDWSAENNGSPITKWWLLVIYGPDRKEIFSRVDPASDGTYSQTLTMLPGLDYEFTAEAENSIGRHPSFFGPSIYGAPLSVSYNGQSNTSGSVPVNSTIYLRNGSVVLAGNTGTLARTGYTWAGWTVNSNGTGTVYSGGETYTLGNSNLILYAKWSPNTLTVTYDSKGGTDVNAGSVLTGGSLSAPTAPTRTGYNFAYWSATDGGTALTFPYAPPNTGSFTLYARWTAKTLAVSFDTQGGSSITSGSTTTGGGILISPGTPTRSGYSFNGWFAASTGGSALTFPYAHGQTADFTLYAQWSAVTYTITYAKNGATGDLATSSDTYTTGGTAITLPGRGTLVKAGHTFAGWSVGGNTPVLSGGYTTTSHVTLSTVWTPISYTITYNPNNGDSTPTQASLTIGQTFTLANAITRAPSGGISYQFAGWDNGATIFHAGEIVTIGTANLSYTAVWAQLYEVTYINNGGNFAGTDTKFDAECLSNNLCTNNQAITLNAAPTRAGYEFTGWEDQSGTAVVDTNSGTAGVQTTVTSTRFIFSANWTAVTYTITYVSSGSAAPTQSSLTIGQSFIVGSAVTRTGYTFNGYSDGTNTYLPGATYVVGAANITLTAHWIADVYTVSYDWNGSIGTATSASTFTVGTSGDITLPSQGNQARTNYSFDGWSLTRDGAKLSGSTYVPTASVTLYARWIIDVYTVTYSVQGGTGIPGSATTDAGGSVTLPRPTRNHYVFLGWYDTTNGGSLVSLADIAYAPSTSVTLYARWRLSSLTGFTDAQLTRVLSTAKASSNEDRTFTFNTTGGYGVSVFVPKEALPNNTELGFYLAASPSATAKTRISGTINYVLTVVIAWSDPTGDVPDTASGSPIRVTISDSSIKAGAIVYSQIAGQVVELGRATQNGSVTVNITSDPEIFVVQSKPTAPASVSATDSVSGVSTVTWNAPADMGGSALIYYTVTSSGNEVCRTTEASCTVSGLTDSNRYSFTVTATNGVGTSDASTTSNLINPPAPTSTPTPAPIPAPTPAPTPDTPPLKIAKELADAKAKAEAQAQADKIASDAKAAAAELKAAEAKAAEDVRIAEELRKAKEKADADLKLAAEKKALEDSQAAAALAAKKIIPEVTLYSISSKLTLSAYDKAYLNKYISTLKSKANVTCIGYYYLKNTALAKAKARALVQATAMCKMIKKAKPTIITKIATYSSSKAPKAAQGAKWVAISYRVDSFKSK